MNKEQLKEILKNHRYQSLRGYERGLMEHHIEALTNDLLPHFEKLTKLNQVLIGALKEAEYAIDLVAQYDCSCEEIHAQMCSDCYALGVVKHALGVAGEAPNNGH